MMRHLSHLNFSVVFAAIILLFACNPQPESASGTDNQPAATSQLALFEKLDPNTTGVHFQNGVQDDNNVNVINFSYLYIGGGVGVGDFNNDGLQDLYFISTQGSNKLYLNKGGLSFEDITEKAGVAGKTGIKMGVTLVDVNADGFLDIYVCRTGLATDERSNFLFINNKNLTFTESAKSYGLDDRCSSNHANFFDYDLDGDLDLYLVNHPDDFSSISQIMVENKGGKMVRSTKPDTPFESDRLYRNNGNNTFTDVSAQAGIINRAFGLSCTVSDVNRDGYPDIYIGNDYIEPDILYINNRNGTFSNQIDAYFRHISHFTMGADFSDINNDGRQDFLAMDMLPENNERQKLLATAMVNDRYNTLVNYGYGHQIMRNMLQINNGRDFSEIGVMAGISATDWTWGPVAMDFDNDGWKDVFMANGILRDFTNNDYISFTLDSFMRTGGVVTDINDLIKRIPSVKLSNYMYRNRGDLRFEDVSNAWGFGDKTFSNGSVYADLDGDGDLEIIVNNLLDPAGIYENKTRQLTGNHFLQLAFEGSSTNPFAVGAAVRITGGNEGIQYQEITPTRGFFSSQQYLAHFGLGDQTQVEQLDVRWPDGKVQTLKDLKADRKITLRYADAQKGSWTESTRPAPLFRELQPAATGIDFLHRENNFLDYDREFLIPHNLSAQGPCIAVGDVDGDGLDDFYVGGATDQAGVLYVQTPQSRFKKISSASWESDKAYEDTACAFFDADGDKDLDLWVVSGGNVHPQGAELYQSRLYFNDGKGNFNRAANAVPKTGDSGSCVTLFDFDRDGDLDVFIGGRVVAGAYPVAPDSYVFQNDGGKFTDVTQKVAPAFRRCGMVTAIRFADLDQDGSAEMIVTGEWIPVSVFQMKSGRYQDATAAFGLDQSNGWWNTVVAKDMDGDGDIDLVCGNLGLNTRLRASQQAPLRLFAKDFDFNGKMDPLIAYYENGKSYPLVQRDLMVKQLPGLKKKYLRYAPYSRAVIEDLFPPQDLNSAQLLQVKTFETTYFENMGNGTFKPVPLPLEAQTAPVNKIIAQDFNGDGMMDLLLAGNDYSNDIETARCDAFNGLLLFGKGNGTFRPQQNMDSGFWATREVRDMAALTLKNGGQLFIIANNNAALQAFEYQSGSK